MEKKWLLGIQECKKDMKMYGILYGKRTKFHKDICNVVSGKYQQTNTCIPEKIGKNEIKKETKYWNKRQRKKQ